MLFYYSVPSGLCRCFTTYIDRHRPLETRFGPAQTGPRLVSVQASWGRSGAGLNRSVPVGRKKRCIYKNWM